jgi:hypothetical protein
MVKGIVNSTTTYYPGRHLNKEVSSVGTKVQKFYFAAGMTLAVRSIAGPIADFNFETQTFVEGSTATNTL